VKITWEMAEYLIRKFGRNSMSFSPWTVCQGSSQMICGFLRMHQGYEYLLDNGDKIVWQKGPGRRAGGLYLLIYP